MSRRISGSKLVKKSLNFVNLIDVRLLGKFSVGKRALYLFDILERETLVTHKGIKISGSTTGIYTVELDRWTTNNAVSMLDIQNEWLFWRKQMGYAETSYDAINRVANGAKAIARFENILAYPEMSDYFSAGIWDIDVISRLIANDIDSEMADALLEVSV